MGFVKRNAVAIAIGAIVVVGGSYVGAKAMTSPETINLDAASSGASPAPTSSGSTPTQERGLIRGEGVVARPNGTFPTIRFNRGTLSSVDGTTLVISEADGTTQRLDTSDQTHFRRDGKKASLSDLQPGDHVAVLGTETNGTYVTRMVRAFSPDAWNQHESQRMQRRAARKGASSL